MITDVDIEKLKQVFPTRDELKGFATKDDLNDMRNDLNDMRNDLTRFATKDDLKEMEQRMTKTIDQELKPLKREQRGQLRTLSNGNSPSGSTKYGSSR